MRWLMLVYKIPREPTSSRVYAWRKLRLFGALLVHDSVWVLPAGERARQRLESLSQEVTARGGEAILWESECLSGGEATALVERFKSQTDDAYRRILSALGRRNADLLVLSRKYTEARGADYFGSPLAERVREALDKDPTGDRR